jgi:hypothetical protein
MSDAIRKRLEAIDNVLFGRDAYSPSHILKRPDRAALLQRERDREALRREREELLRTLPATGEASGQHLVLNRSLGTIVVRESAPDYAIDTFDEHADDPYWRFARENGERLD